MIICASDATIVNSFSNELNLKDIYNDNEKTVHSFNISNGNKDNNNNNVWRMIGWLMWIEETIHDPKVRQEERECHGYWLGR